MIRTLFGFGSLWVAWSAGWQNALAQETSIKSPAVQLAPSAAGLTAEKLAELDRWIEETRKAWEVPGLSLAIVTEDQVLLSKGYGVREAGQEATVDADTLFAIASNSKAMTAAAIAILVDEGKLKWDDRVQQFLPWLRLSDPLASNDLRIRDLLCHRSGLGTFSGDLLWWGTPYTPREILERAVHLKSQFPFRANFGYSNLMYLAAGEVIAAVSGKPWSQFIRERILTPLEMNRTVLSIRDLEAIGNVASPHKTFPDRSQPIPWMNWDAMAAAGGVISSSNDMGRWIQLQLREGKLTDGRTLFSEANAFEMWQPQTIIPVSKSRSARVPSTHFRAYGLGWSLADYQGHKLVGHSGGYDGMYSEVLMVPEKKIGVVVLTNSMTSIGTAITYQVIDAALGAPPRDWSEENFRLFQRSRADFASRIQKATQPAAENTAPSHPLQSYTGLFRCPMYGDAQVALVDGKLQLKLLPYPALVADLEHLHYDTFAIRWHQDFAWFESGSAHFVADAQGKFVQIKLDIPNDDLWFYELDLQRVK